MIGELKIIAGFKARELACTRGGRMLFKGVSFSLKPGQGLIVTGPNGSGKTSLLRILSGFLSPDEGFVSWPGETVDGTFNLFRGMTHYLGHAQALKPFLTVRENLEFWQKMLGGEGTPEEASKTTGVLDFLDFPVKFLSEGQRKRVNLARFLVQPMPLWIMDEPTAGLDSDGQKLLKTLILEHLKQGGVFIGATHQDLGIAGLKELTLGKGVGKC